MNLHIYCRPWIIAIVCLTVFVVQSQGQHYKRVCYHTNWSKYRPGPAKFTTNNIDPFLCTHLIFAFGDFDDKGNLRKLDWDDERAYQDFKRLKVINKELKTLLAIGGWNFGSTRYSNMVADPVIRKNFVQSTVSFLDANGFDGLDIDWEYPADAERGGAPQDKLNLVVLCQELKEAFLTESQISGKAPFLLTAAVPASQHKANIGYDIKALAVYLDFINIMTYDFHGGWDKHVGQNSPLFPSPIEEGDNYYLNIRETVNFWHKSGMPKYKIAVGLAAYGRSFSLQTNSYGLGAPARTGPQGPYTREAGFWSYYEICMEIERDFSGSRKGSVYYDTDQEVPFYVNGNLWVGYDNERSIRAKTRWVKENGYSGIMFWSLALDDFNQMCNYSMRPYPLIHAANEELGVPVQQPSTLQVIEIIQPAQPNKPVETVPPYEAVNPMPYEPVQPVQTLHIYAPEVPTVQAPSLGQFSGCPSSGHQMYPHPDCSKYIECADGSMHERDCPGGLDWDETTKACNWPDQAGCRMA